MKELIRSKQKKQGAVKLAGALGLLLALGLIVTLVAVPAMAVPYLSHRLLGEANILPCNIPVWEGAEVTAEIDGVWYATTYVDASGRYGYGAEEFKVPGDWPETPGKEGGAPGDTIDLFIEGVPAGTVDFVPGGVGDGQVPWNPLNLEVTDDIDPSGTIVINDEDACTNNPDVTLSLIWSDGFPSCGVVSMHFSNDNATWSEWEAVAATKEWTLTAGDEVKTVYVEFIDVAGNNSNSIGPISDDIILDTEDPTGTILINDGDDATNDVNVTLTLSSDDGLGSGVVSMHFSNDNATWSAWEPVAATSPWALTAGDGVKTVYVEFLDAAGNNSNSIAIISDDITLLITEVGAPAVTTAAATNTTSNSATLNGILDDLGDYASVDVSFEWGTTSGGPYPNETTPEAMTSPGTFSAGIAGLSSDTTYYFRAKATGSITVYGNELSFITQKVPPVVTTAAATNTTPNSATLNGSLGDLGDYTTVDVSFEWGTTSGGPYPNETTPEAMTSTGAFSAPIAGLLSDTTYYFRAKATGSITVYGDEFSFITFESPPLLYIDLASGWNTFSTPINLDPDYDEWGELVTLAGLNIEIAWYFDGDTQLWGQVLGDYVMSACDAIYVNMVSAGTVPIYPDPDPSVSAKDVFAGLNLVGSAFINEAGELPVNEALISVYYAEGELLPWGYSQVISPGVNQPGWTYPREGTVQNMLIGKGYWVAMDNADEYLGQTSTPWEP